MKPHRPYRKHLRRLGVVATGVFILLWVAGYWCLWTYYGTLGHAMIGWGHVVYAPVTETVTSTDFVAGWPRGKGKSSKFLTGFFADEDDDRTLRIGIPLWFPILVVGGLTAYAYRKELFAARPAPQDAICSKCNYDRRGLDPAAACPECKSTPNHPD